MKIKTERNLYNLVKSKLRPSGILETSLNKKGMKSIYLIGEKHGSKDAVDYMHHRIVPKIKENPEKWILFREGLNSFNDYSESEILQSRPDTFYFNKLPELLKIIGEDVVKSPLESDVKKYVLKNTSLSEKDIDTWYFITYAMANQNTPEEEMEEGLIKKLGKPRNYLFELSNSAQGKTQTELSILHNSLLSTWNKYSKEKFKEILNKNPEKENIVVSVGKAHLPAFSGDSFL